MRWGEQDRDTQGQKGCRKWMDLQTVIVSEVNQTEKQKCLMTSNMWNKKKSDTNEHISKTED